MEYHGIGGIIGDIVGSPYEFDSNNYKNEDFPLFSQFSHFTDDTVMTLAVGAGLAKSLGKDEKSVKNALIENMIELGEAFPNAGYGARFRFWFSDPKPYGSYGNGSAMRVSPVGWFFNTLEETLKFARISAEVSHNHPEGIKGAQATAAAIFLARNGKGKDEIRDYIEKTFAYDLSRTIAQIRPNYYHVESCQQTVPEAITAYLEADSFEDTLRKAVSLGGDSDTLTDIAAAIAEGSYDIPEEIARKAIERLDGRLLDALYIYQEGLQKVRSA